MAELNHEAVCQWLLKEQFYLTALELHTELLEGGLRSELLTSFFSNSANFTDEPAGLCTLVDGIDRMTCLLSLPPCTHLLLLNHTRPHSIPTRSTLAIASVGLVRVW